MDHLKTRLEDKSDAPNVVIKFMTRFTTKPMAKQDNLQRTREDHIKIWKLIELATRESVSKEGISTEDTEAPGHEVSSQPTDILLQHYTGLSAASGVEHR